jgi:hypothetical protein
LRGGDQKEEEKETDERDERSLEMYFMEPENRTTTRIFNINQSIIMQIFTLVEKGGFKMQRYNTQIRLSDNLLLVLRLDLRPLI